MKQFFNFCAVSVFVFTLLCSCAANPPKDERELAEKAFADAKVGKDCDRTDYLAAEELLKQAREEVNNKNYDKAKEFFKMVKEKSDAVLKYYSEHPEECLEKSGKGENGEDDENCRRNGTCGTGIGEDGSISEEDVDSEEVDPALDPKNPDMEFQVIHFEYNQYAVLEEDLPKIKLMAEWMMNFPEKVILIEGHADERGSNDYNLSLGEKRAAEVRNKLIQEGIDFKRINLVSYGEERPVDPASNEEAWFKNRRAEFKHEN